MTDKTKETRKRKKTLQPSLPQAIQQEGQHLSPQSPEYQASIPGLDAKGISSELLPSRLNFMSLLYLFFSVLLAIPSLLSYSITPFSYPPFLVLQCIVLPPKYSFCPFHPLLPMFLPPLPILP
jgi:hypothetical protein